MKGLPLNSHFIAIMVSRWQYYRRIFAAYILGGRSHLTFWHDKPTLNPLAKFQGSIGQYYMNFDMKAAYTGPFDSNGIPMLDYRGKIGRQYNPIAIAQYGLGNYNIYCQIGSNNARNKFLNASDWLVDNLQPNYMGKPVWHHQFDFEYRDLLRAPWYSGLAQGQGISLLVRAYKDTSHKKYLEAANRAFECFLDSTNKGGVTSNSSAGELWFEEYIVDPPTHILNGFIWSMWGVYDYAKAAGSQEALDLFQRATMSLENHLHLYEWWNWSLYELSGTKMKMISSPFYHKLHIVQLRATAYLSGQNILLEYADRWEHFAKNNLYKTRALLYKMLFKIFYY